MYVVNHGHAATDNPLSYPQRLQTSKKPDYKSVWSLAKQGLGFALLHLKCPCVFLRTNFLLTRLEELVLQSEQLPLEPFVSATQMRAKERKPTIDSILKDRATRLSASF